MDNSTNNFNFFIYTRFVILTALVVLLTQPAYAHAPIPGVDSFVNGAIHPLIIPSQVLLLISLGLLIGGQGDKAIGSVLPVFLICLVFGAGISLISKPLPEWFMLIGAMAIALWVIGRWKMVDNGLYLIAILTAFFVGSDSLIEEFNGGSRYISLLGSCLGAYILVLYISAIAERLRLFKKGIVLRILGSWIVASILLVLSLNVISNTYSLSADFTTCTMPVIAGCGSQR